MTAMHMPIRFPRIRIKSRLAGFFLLLLTSCQPDIPSLPGALEFGKAQRALQAELPIKAAEHLVIAIKQGHPDAAVQWLALTRAELGPLQQYHQLRSWRSQALDTGAATQLGLWQQQGVVKPQLAAWPANRHCAVKVQPVLTSAVAISHWQKFYQDWPSSDFATLPVCFLEPELLDSRIVRCSEQIATRIQCDAEALRPTVSRGQAQILLVVGGRGQASFNNGWLQLPENFAPALFRHEFSHALGFLDEYALRPAVAAVECERDDINPNILFDRSDLARYAAHWQLPLATLSLTPIQTCNGANKQAYRVISADSHMQHYELPVPALYLDIMQQQLTRPQHIMPVQYYFAYLARQQQDLHNRQLLLKQAAAFGYASAQQVLAGEGLSSTAR
jgi:hypothetical protein